MYSLNDSFDKLNRDFVKQTLIRLLIDFKMAVTGWFLTSYTSVIKASFNKGDLRLSPDEQLNTKMFTDT